MSAAELFDQCASNLKEQSSVQDLAACISTSLQKNASESSTDATTTPQSILLVYAASLVFLMQAGFAMVCAGAVRTKNVQNSMIKNVLYVLAA
jgi:Amt family ammonium transporter